MRHTPLIVLLLAGASLAACQKADTTNAASTAEAAPPPAALAVTNDAAAPIADAPDASALPAAPAPPVAAPADPAQAYAPADNAYAMSSAFGDSPPDYTYDQGGGVQPWVWTASDNSQRIAEAVPGGERYYYYQPGATQPYYVQDPDYGYAYQGGSLTVVFDKSGHRLAAAQFSDRLQFAGRFLARGQALKQSAASAQHRAIAAADWNARRSYISDQQQAWTKQTQSDPDWRTYHDHHAGQEQRQWSAENARRESWAAQTDARTGDAARAAEERQRAAAAQGGGAPQPGPAGQPGPGGQPGQNGQPGRGGGDHPQPGLQGVAPSAGPSQHPVDGHGPDQHGGQAHAPAGAPGAGPHEATPAKPAPPAHGREAHPAPAHPPAAEHGNPGREDPRDHP